MPTVKKKKKQPSLSPWHSGCVMPNMDASVDKMNQSLDVDMSANEGSALGESTEKLNLDVLKMEIVTTTLDYMTDELGFEEDDASAYCDFDIIDEGDRYMVEVRVDSFGVDNEGELCTKLDKVISKYDTDAYFEPDYPGILQAYIYKDVPVLESLRRIDIHNDSYELRNMYEALQSKLSSQDKAKLKKFVDKTNDTSEIETYMKGLLSKDNNKGLD